MYLLFLEAVRPRFMRSDLSIMAIYRVYSYGSWFDNMAKIPRPQRDIYRILPKDDISGRPGAGSSYPFHY